MNSATSKVVTTRLPDVLYERVKILQLKKGLRMEKIWAEAMTDWVAKQKRVEAAR